ncbi:unnamed protein product [Haemonchus placei]|uniref:CUB domain-containing protein n=1 Tax=Haemonchus placei TaxID=6290 RepID=A0A0N4W822_HAEPC|nr:unnamed protein product [Haemonchus placei]
MIRTRRKYVLKTGGFLISASELCITATHLDRAVAVDPSCFELLHMRGRFSYQAEQLRPGITENRLYLGRVLYAKGDYAEAKKWLIEAAKATCDDDEPVEREHIRAAREMLQLKMKRKLLHPNSSDTFENRKRVKEILGSLNLRVRNLHRAGAGKGPSTTPIPTPDLGPKNNFTDLTSEAHPEIADWMFEGDIALTPEQAEALVRGGNDAFAVNPNIHTIQTLKPEYQNTLGQREQPAFSDVRMMNWLYNCSSLCVNTPVPACRSPGFPNPRNCYECICPRMFAGSTCQNLPTGTAPNCNGKVVEATSTSWTTLNGVAGNPNSYSTSSTPTDCYWHISAPAGRKIQIRLSSPPSNCMEGCPWQAIEINLGNFDLYGIIVCCSSSQVYTSVDNLVGIRGRIRYNQLKFGLDYRIV